MKINTIKYMAECVFRYIAFCFFWTLTTVAIYKTIIDFFIFISHCGYKSILSFLGLFFILFPFFMYFIHKKGLIWVFFRPYENFKLVPKSDKLSFKFTFLSYIQIYLVPYILFYICLFKHSFDKNGSLYYLLHNIVGDYLFQIFLITLLIALLFLIKVIKNNTQIMN